MILELSATNERMILRLENTIDQLNAKLDPLIVQMAEFQKFMQSGKPTAPQAKKSFASRVIIQSNPANTTLKDVPRCALVQKANDALLKLEARVDGENVAVRRRPHRREEPLPASVYRPARWEEPLPESWPVDARREGFLPTSWFKNQLAGRGSSRRVGLWTLAGRNPSRQAGTQTSSPGPVDARREGFLPAVWPLGTGYPKGYPDTRQYFRGKGASTPEYAPAGGNPPADSRYPRRIIRDHL
ncbi:hypothetical protein PGTUg99_035361 [Puccinia graminis f. sp. tritici]|uniref:Uncharacterized protein n=1 Tax=Puccinia graminis f. sp. tritici TaxID=56615 RepID=A0A5B0SMA1_PUCGR|nr:hypothetical protein PGTUg99_035361 [Puccinia graminis f. sp. tritici]